MWFRAAALAFALALPFAAFAREAGEGPRPCIDWVASGTLTFERTDDLKGVVWPHTKLATYRMSVSRGIWQAQGPSDLAVLSVGRGGPFMPGPKVVFRGRNDTGDWRIADITWLGRDMRGREFAAIFGPDDAWLPRGWERLRHPLRFEVPGGGWTQEDALPGYREVRGGHKALLQGIYLDDLPTLLDASRDQSCARNWTL